MKHMLLIPTDDSPATLVDADSLDQMQAHLGGYIERVRVGENWAMLVNEDGIRLDLPVNRVAGLLYGTPQHGQPIHGPALLGREGMVPPDYWVDFIDTDRDEALRFILRRQGVHA